LKLKKYAPGMDLCWVECRTLRRCLYVIGANLVLNMHLNKTPFSDLGPLAVWVSGTNLGDDDGKYYWLNSNASIALKANTSKNCLIFKYFDTLEIT
jgi:hypothetical protein